MGNGDGTFGALFTKPFPSSTHSTAVADFNGDGRLDIVGARGAVELQAPAVTLSKKTLTFPTTKVGKQSAPKSATVTNSGSANLEISSITSNSSDFLPTSDCPSVLATGTTCTVSVVFKPSIVGLEIAALTITDNARFGKQKVTVRGTGD